MAADEPTPEQIREFIAAQICPWCKAGPFRSLSRHTQHRHAITARDLRDRAGLIRNARICSQELSATMTDRNLTMGLTVTRSEHASKPDYSEAGLRSLRKSIKEAKQKQTSDPVVRARMMRFWSNHARSLHAEGKLNRPKQRDDCAICGARISSHYRKKNKTCGRSECKSALLSLAAQKSVTARTRTHCPQGHEYTAENTYMNGNRRNCRSCARDRYHTRKAH